jgi:phosphatidylglycerophosphate synthase
MFGFCQVLCYHEYMAQNHEKPSNKLLTLPNLITAWGGVMIVKGLFGKNAGLDTKKGIGLAIAGMGIDAVDGLAARYLPKLVKRVNPSIDTERLGPSTFGNRLEHTADKIKIALLAVELWRKKLVPRPMVGILSTLEAAKAATTAALYIRSPKGFDTKPTDNGRHGNALMLTGLGLEFLAGRMGAHSENRGAAALRGIGRAAFGAGTVLTIDATRTYYKRLKSANNPEPAIPIDQESVI